MEKNGIADVVGSDQEDDRTVNTEPHASGRSHPVFERAQKIVINILYLFTHLIFKHLTLDNGVILFRVGGSDFLPVDA